MSSNEVATPRETIKIWLEEENSPSYRMKLALKRILFEGQSPFQKVQVVETEQFGKTLILDGKTQSCIVDEFIYHETLVHPAMLLHPNPKTVFIGGGGELATAREVLKHKSVEKVVMVDIDETVVDICRKELPEWSDGCFDDPRLTVIYDDAKKQMEDYDGKFDVIIMDIADPIEAGPGIVLYTQEYYQFLVNKMNPNCVFVTQSGPCSSYNVTDCFTTIHSTLKTTFKHVLPFSVEIPSFGGHWGFNIAYNEGKEDYRSRPEKEIDEAVAEGISGELKHYDGITHAGLFGLGKSQRKALADETRVMTIDNPVFIW